MKGTNSEELGSRDMHRKFFSEYLADLWFTFALLPCTLLVFRQNKVDYVILVRSPACSALD